MVGCWRPVLSGPTSSLTGFVSWTMPAYLDTRARKQKMGMAQAGADLEGGVRAGAEAEATLRLGLLSALARLAKHSAAQQRGLAQT